MVSYFGSFLRDLAAYWGYVAAHWLEMQWHNSEILWPIRGDMHGGQLDQLDRDAVPYC